MSLNIKIDLYKKLVGFLTKKGQKIKAKQIINSAFLIVSKKTKYSLPYLLVKIFLKLNTFVEAKTVRIKRSSHIVPFSLTLKRRSYLIIKWLIKAVSENSTKTSIVNKIADEILNILTNSNSKALKYKQLNNIQAFSNRSKIHYRW